MIYYAILYDSKLETISHCMTCCLQQYIQDLSLRSNIINFYTEHSARITKHLRQQFVSPSINKKFREWSEQGVPLEKINHDFLNNWKLNHKVHSVADLASLSKYIDYDLHYDESIASALIAEIEIENILIPHECLIHLSGDFMIKKREFDPNFINDLIQRGLEIEFTTKSCIISPVTSGDILMKYAIKTHALETIDYFIEKYELDINATYYSQHINRNHDYVGLNSQTAYISFAATHNIYSAFHLLKKSIKGLTCVIKACIVDDHQDVLREIIQCFDMRELSLEDQESILIEAIRQDDTDNLTKFATLGFQITDNVLSRSEICSIRMIKLLMSYGLDVKTVAENILVESICNNPEVFEFTKDIGHLEDEMEPILLQAVEFGNVQIATYAMSRITNVSVENDYIPVSVAAVRSFYVEFLKMFVDFGIDFNDKFISGVALLSLIKGIKHYDLDPNDWIQAFVYISQYSPISEKCRCLALIACKSSAAFKAILEKFSIIDLNYEYDLDDVFKIEHYILGKVSYIIGEHMTLAEIVVFLNLDPDVNNVLDLLFKLGAMISDERLTTFFTSCFKNVTIKSVYNIYISRLEYFRRTREFKFKHRCLSYLKKYFA